MQQPFQKLAGFGIIPGRRLVQPLAAGDDAVLRLSAPRAPAAVGSAVAQGAVQCRGINAALAARNDFLTCIFYRWSVARACQGAGGRFRGDRSRDIAGICGLNMRRSGVQ